MDKSNEMKQVLRLRAVFYFISFPSGSTLSEVLLRFAYNSQCSLKHSNTSVTADYFCPGTDPQSYTHSNRSV